MKTVYIVTNDSMDGKNAVIAFENDGKGNLSAHKNSPFSTGGTGYRSNYELPHVGPMDADQSLIANESGTRLYGTNGGSDNVFVMDIAEDGSLSPVNGSPFASNGVNPVSIGLAGDKLVVVNKNEDPLRDMKKTLPNYSTFAVTENGGLSSAPLAKLDLPTVGRSPTQALIVDGKYMYDGDIGRFPQPSRQDMFGTSMLMDGPSVLRAFVIDGDGSLKPHAPLTPPDEHFVDSLDIDGDGVADPLMFGLAKHPTAPYVYICYVTSGKVGVYKIGANGQLTFVNAVDNSGSLSCWIKFNQDGTRAYTTNTGDWTVSTYDTTDPENPKEIQCLKLKKPGNPFQIDIDSADEFVYVVSLRAFPDVPEGDGNYLNIFKVGENGELEEVESSPVKIPTLDPTGSPQGVVAL